MSEINKIKKTLAQLKNAELAEKSKRFFKTAPGSYADKDLFMGISVPVLRKIAKENSKLSLKDLQQLIKSKFHEERALALMILVLKFKKTDKESQEKIYNFYLKNIRYVNNWDLVDISAHHIVGAFLEDKNTSILIKLARSKNLWARRIAIVSTWFFIRKNNFTETIKIAKILLNDSEDLIHKATGWMLRELGKKDLGTLEKFLAKHHRSMPRTMLRYAIEKFPAEKRKILLLK